MSNRFGNCLPQIHTDLPGKKSKELTEILRKYDACGLSPISKGAMPIFWAKAKGANVLDVDNNLFIDCTSGFGVAAVGHRNNAVVSSIKQQCENLIHSVGDIFPNPMRAELIELLVGKVGRNPESQVILVNSGSEAVEVAIQTAILNKNKPGVIAFHGGFHGQTLGSLSVSSQRSFRDPFWGRIASNTVFVPFPNPFRPIFETNQYTVGDFCLNYIENILASKVSGAPAISSILIEPIQGINGYIIPPDGFLSGLRILCDKYDILLIADEIFTGFGRAGAWLAIDHSSVIPDITCVGKAMTGGMPIAACLASEELMRSWETEGFIQLHGSTFAAHPVNCASAIAAIKELERLDLIKRSREKGDLMLSQLHDLLEYGNVGDVRGKGMAIAIEIVKDKFTKLPDPEFASSVVFAVLKKGILCITTGFPNGNIIALSPTLTISNSQINYICEALYSSVREVSISNRD